MRGLYRRAVAAGALLTALSLTACTVGPPSGNAGTAGAQASARLSSAVQKIMHKPAYSKAAWSVLATDLDTGKTLFGTNADRLAFTGSTRKLFSVGLALTQLGADHTTTTSVYRTGELDGGSLQGDLVLVGAGDLTFGGRRTADNQLAYTDFDHNDANNLGTGIITPHDPLTGVQALADQIKAAGVTHVTGNVVIDDDLFTPYRVPNQQLLVTPTMINENMIDVVVTPTSPGEPARIAYRPETSAFAVTGTVMTTAAGTVPTVSIPPGTTPAGTSVTGVVNCVGQANCTGQISGTIPVDYKAPLSGLPYFLGTFRIDNPEAFARTALIDALQRDGITVDAPAVGPDPTSLLAPARHYSTANRLAEYTSAPFAQQARLILKVSLNLGANLALTQFGLAKGQKTLDGALAAERRALIAAGIPGDSFRFPTNGSGSPDSEASPRAIVDMLAHMNTTPVADDYRNALPLLGVDGSLSSTGADLPAKGHVHGKTGTTATDGKLVAQNLAGYIDAKSGHRIAFAIILNDYGKLESLDDVLHVLADEAAITNVLYLNG
ncbi:D-alanyl-D-alanine carboxypeptidase/D-alanyl-D-alanine endopeptidase [Rathayibacter soli]|uniref:D-alanyl-D-alanine carboxypeptidase/D-alanyl-D-alanine endopeptidase n=1 Tax=Rathayibacter soli TaxID=3144168 RepID=UPI0027E5A127|nr:D-alanyl-D-alanine carboxypeptidase/D-alanyl-D-alanine-endopeptidase [Glaciibacter superstes]